MTVFLLLSDLPARQVTNLADDRVTVTAILLDLACAKAIASPAWIHCKSLVMIPQILMQ